MDNDPTDGNTAPMYLHLDGPVAKDIRLAPGPLSGQLMLARQYVNYSSVNVNIHAQNVEWVAHQAATELERAVDWLNEYSGQDNLSFRVSFCDGNSYGAFLEERSARNSSYRDCLISVRLGSIPRLIGIANRLNMLGQSPVIGALLLGHGGEVDWGIIPWDPETEPIGSTVWESDTSTGMGHTLDIVVSAMLLMFFHEAAHGCAAHGYITKRQNFDLLKSQYHRAMEMEADWGAGMLFAKYRTVTDQQDAATLVQQLLYGSQCNYLALQIERGLKGSSDANYHLPHTRSHWTLSGAQHAVEGLPVPIQDFVELVNDTYQPIQYLEKLFPKSIKGWLPYDSTRSQRDMVESRDVSIPLIRFLRKSHGFKRARPLDEFPDEINTPLMIDGIAP